MPADIDIHIGLPKPIAEAWLQSLRSELRQGFDLHWYDDRYRHVPEPLRSARILDDHPALAGHKRTIGALQAALTANR
ncbi:hypothetical protein BVH03_25075 [Pseudomonas sp. PA15(2017)]|uniref:hypothetical protein n=1 Tax=Pseudomonas sp. PA15(2017) TaxID=1932111 RepID=UPI0009613046|nr:hypothetical protein [Pseudomonas sp. PA15(2017)]OLU22496.1 hypothetical protein BVH03_25075 [Pseudomonas sp. PA15(2017)]